MVGGGDRRVGGERDRGGTAGKLALALDLDDMIAALRLARRLRPWFGVAKVGLELFSAAGPEVVSALAGDGWQVFLDLKLHDIPTTVRRAARVLGGLGICYLTLHSQGGQPMLEAGVAGLAEGAAAAGLAPPVALAVTVLTSEAEAPQGELARRASLAWASGCGGVVCAAPDLAEVRRVAPHLLTVVPGTRPAGSERHDQGRVATPAEALARGADLLVIGRAVTACADPQAAARSLTDDVAGALGAGASG
jgi:orotidine-5'-phosphate decarboxylase